MKIKQLLLTLLVLVLVTGCIPEDRADEKPDDQPITILESQKGDYPILLPFEYSPLRQEYASYFREVDMMEIGSRLQEKTKEHFDPKDYYISEGSLINEDRYYSLLGYQSDQNPNGLNLKPFEIKDGSVTITDPKFVSDIMEVNFHKTNDLNKIDGMGIALVLKRVQVLDPKIGSTHRLSDEVLYEVGRTLGLRLYSYLTSLEGMSDIPIYIGLYVQESDVDQLPGKYLPGHYIGHAFFESRSDQFVKDNEQWLYLSGNQANDIMPDFSSGFNRFKKSIYKFTSDENVGVVGKGFIINDKLQTVQIEVITGSKTYLELYGLAQFIAEELKIFEEAQVPITVNIKIHQNSRIVLEKEPGKDIKFIEVK